MTDDSKTDTSLHRPEVLEAWQRLNHLKQTQHPIPDSQSVPRIHVGSLTADFSRQRVDGEIVQALHDLAEQSDMSTAIQRQFRGDPVNVTEARPVLHTALRAPYETCPASIRDEVRQERDKLIDFARRLRSGAWRGYTGKAIECLVHIGIGGSNLGPECAWEALKDMNDSGIECRFLASIDPRQLDRTLKNLDAETTLFVVVSKSFGTLETRSNADAVRSWFLERSGSLSAMHQHFVAVTSHPERAQEFGISADNLFAMWDWVGGRFSLWSSVGLPLAVMLGETAYRSLLAGACTLDQHVSNTPVAQNLPVWLALLAVWNSNFLGTESHAVLAYDHRLKLLPAHLQQVEMESLGKSVHNDGTPCSIATGCILWGGEEPQGQHAYHQLLHQGTRQFSADFIACATSAGDHPEQHVWLLANCLSQGQALYQGQPLDPLRQDPLAPHKFLPGKHPSTTLLLSELTPEALGELLALYEHKVMCLGILLDINAWDQWGVELGKTLARQIHQNLVGVSVSHSSTAQQEPLSADTILAVSAASQDKG